MLALFVTFKVKAGCMDEFIQVSLANSRGSINGPGCYATSMFVDPNDENVAHVFEVFEDEDALEAHHQQDYYKEWESKVNDLMDGNYTYVRNSDFPSSDGIQVPETGRGRVEKD